MQVQAMINKILFFSLTISCCLHASTTETPQIGWKETLTADLARGVTDARQGLLAKLGIEKEFEQVDLDALAQSCVDERNQQLALTNKPLIDPNISDELIQLIKSRCVKFKLDFDSLQISRTDQIIGGGIFQ